MGPAQLTLPLAGGREGATVRLHPLLTGELFAPEALLERPPGPLGRLKAIGMAPNPRRWIPVPAFLIEHPEAGPVVVDTGLHPSVAVKPSENMGLIGARTYKYRVTAGQDVRSQVRERGLDPDDVATVVMTHLHWDHAGGVSELPRATFVLDAREWPAAHRHLGFLEGYRQQQFVIPGVEWRTLDQSAAPAHGAFDHGVDLFGDGSVIVVATPGHSTGHQSVLVRLAGRRALLTADAAYTLRNIHERTTPGLWKDAAAWERSMGMIRSHLAAEPDTVVIPGHDPDAWKELDDVYA